MVKSRGQHCGDIELAGYLANTAGPVPLVLDLRLSHDRFGSSSDPTLNGRLHYNDIDKSLNETANDKIRKYRADYNNNPPNSDLRLSSHRHSYEKPQQHYSTCQNKVLMGSATHQFNKYTAKLQSVAHNSMYLEEIEITLDCFENSQGKAHPWQEP